MGARTDLAHDWTLLHRATEATDDLSGAPFLTTGIDCGHGSVLIALSDSGGRRLLIPIGRDTRLSPVASNESICVRDNVLNAGGDDTRFVDIICIDPSLNDVFARVCDQIIARLAIGGAADATVQQVFDEFRHLLQGKRLPLSTREIIGLVGELCVLRDLTRLSGAAVSRWTGPAGGRHDFGSPGISLEVKTSTRRDAPIVTISSIDQLAPPENGRLCLSYVGLEEHPAGSLTIRSLVESILSDGGPRDEIEARLVKLGIRWEDLEGFDHVRLSKCAQETYSVDDSFPRLIRASFPGGELPSGITTCEYTIDLTAAEPCRMEDSAVRTLLEELARS